MIYYIADFHPCIFYTINEKLKKYYLKGSDNTVDQYGVIVVPYNNYKLYDMVYYKNIYSNLKWKLFL